MAKVLILDQSKSLRNTLRERLEFEGFSTESADSETQALELCEHIPFDLIISEHEDRLPHCNIPFIVLSTDPTVESAIKALRNGAQDYLTKPIDMNRLLLSIRHTLEQQSEESVRTSVKQKRSVRSGSDEQIIGDSEAMQHVHQMIAKVASCDARVLITGENGTGKELVARALHAKSSRANAPFVEVNCAAIPSELIESELFGHERGAFTSAIKQRKGKFEQANGGTLFMDEIGDMSLAAQAKVLRALQENKISRVGSDRDIEVDVRIIAATNKNLLEEIKKGNFREDLYHRIGVIIIKVPPLREHPEDIPQLVDHFIGLISKEYKIPEKQIDKKAMEMLQGMPWSGNIRELRNVVERLLVLSDQKITSKDVEKYC
ncbi:MAG TPA: sigma-54 dependent transcriptional regulator [Candidatus Alistipes avicola]|uniref:Sigma-54 dependent transcriptional regulator n=1 Tax=Candidatus Alistipes avicola TaxID=2838432 RepID=A0A9D2IAU1_9BACT|nr:sigma-54 dependent transcriptional regulator [uncultured Alistipes sp.]HJA98400.1 sigma-54 dependent transcriptional regulator [Candidatus Alistipes avicola]